MLYGFVQSFYWFVFIFLGGYLINLLLSDTLAWCWRFLFVLEEEGQTGSPVGAAQRALSPRPVAQDWRPCRGPKAKPLSTSWKWGAAAPGSGGGEKVGLFGMKHYVGSAGVAPPCLGNNP